jgi:hypothetical protein|uniref:Uncharacterized protein n=2 Tax=unclassified Caudoviricetes TaxID=2788787 RepID=A0A8S5UN04_9CAUD|nr:MAG TPA: hypothetical protein [Siphoviridae sp. ctsus30]DAF95861.1 MAG TPA: hypothetical protein [Siphoviridae sp. ctKGQ3]
MSAEFGHSLLQEIFNIATSEYSNNPSNMSWFTVKGYAEALIELAKENDNG